MKFYLLFIQYIFQRFFTQKNIYRSMYILEEGVPQKRLIIFWGPWHQSSKTPAQDDAKKNSIQAACMIRKILN